MSVKQWAIFELSVKQNVGATFMVQSRYRVEDGDDPYHILGKRSLLELAIMNSTSSTALT